LAEFAFKGSQAGVEHVPFRDDHDIEPANGLVTTENLSYQSFSFVPLDRAPELPGGGDAQPAARQVGGQCEQREEPAVDLGAAIVNLLVFGSPADTVIAAETSHLAAGGYSLLTVRRFRPFARRRFRTRRPFFVLMRTRNPCVRARWRVFG
jgi:hypothetical protein